MKATPVTGVEPSDFMRARRPYLFSDSKVSLESQLSPEVFEYHLDSLTSRKQETEFEHFCRRLLEKEICPNLLPQTGPTGGGDSKVDAETYPVADSLALRWYEGIAREASQQRWAFAFSAKADWRAKVQSDIKQIANTEREYKLVYFVTNQFVRDKLRSQVEEDLEAKYGIPVRILDRTWIVKRVIEHDRVRIAIETLRLSPAYQEKRITGPQDTEREMELRELEEQISDPLRYIGVEYQLAEDCLEAALLARGLELPRVEVEGRFDRAERIANRVNLRPQRLRIAYHRAWTAFWWYNDYQELDRLYYQVEKLATESDQADELELLKNLWQLIHTSVQRGKLEPIAAKLDERTQTLKAELDRLVMQENRPNNTLAARSIRLLMDLTETLTRKESIDGILHEFKSVFEAATNLAEFPVESLTGIVRELGEVISHSPSYDELFEEVVDITERRTRQGTSGILLLERGYQQLGAGRHYQAISLLGRAQQKLALYEYTTEWLRALAGCGLAYEAAGLLWAARSNFLMAANLALSEYWKQGKLNMMSLALVNKLVWLELQLGRVAHVLAWLELASLISGQLGLADTKKDNFLKQREIQDMVLGLLFLKSDLSSLQALQLLPHTLDKMGLGNSWMALMYALGYETYLRMEGAIPQDENEQVVRDVFAQWLQQRAAADLPQKPELGQPDFASFRSYVLGCEVIVSVGESPLSELLGETVLGVLESFLATSLDSDLLPFRSDLRISIRQSEYIGPLPQYVVNETAYEADEPTIVIAHGPVILRNTDEHRRQFHSWLLQLVIEITLQIALTPDEEIFTKNLFHNDSAAERALNLSDVMTPIANIMGTKPKIHLSDWNDPDKDRSFPLQRTIPWYDGIVSATEEVLEPSVWKAGEGEPPDNLFGIDNLKHKDRSVFSLVNVPLWDRASWHGMIYLYSDDLGPMLGIGFRNADAGQQIFREWRTKLGVIDERDQLRVTIVKGIDSRYPSHYAVNISTNLPSLKEGSSRQFVVTSRTHRMEAQSLHNLTLFLEHYQKSQKYTLIPVHMVSEMEGGEVFWDLGIEKRTIQVREAWQIGENDPDVSVIQPDILPILPSDVADPPVLRALQRLERRNKRE